MTEYGIFNDEGYLEGQFFTEQQAREAITERYPDEDDVEVREVCYDHSEQPAYGCEECDADQQ